LDYAAKFESLKQYLSWNYATGACRLTAREKERRRRLGLCDYRGEKGHSVVRCPVFPSSKRLSASRPLVSFEIEVMEKESTQK